MKINSPNYGSDKIPTADKSPQPFPNAGKLTPDISRSLGSVLGTDDPLNQRIPRRNKKGLHYKDYGEALFKYREEKYDPDKSLIDEWLAGTYQLPKYVKKNMARDRRRLERVEQDCVLQRSLIKRSSRFFLDDEFVEMATTISATTKPDRLKQMIQMATLPYEVTYLEFNLHVKVSTSAKILYPENDFEVSPTVPKRMGLLLKRDQTRPTAWVMYVVGPLSFTEDSMDEVVTTQPGIYLFDAMESPALAQSGAAGLRPFIKKTSLLTEQLMTPSQLWEGMQAMSWGYGFKSLAEGVSNESVGETFDRLAKVQPAFLVPHSSLTVNVLYDAVLESVQTRAAGEPDYQEMIQSWFMDLAVGLKENAGILRWVVTVLSMLNEVPTTSTHVVKPGTQRIGLSHKNLLDHHRLSLKLPKTRPIQFIERKLTHAIAAKKRAHEVRSHWRTYQKELSCKPAEHAWIYDHPNGYRLCEKCESFGRLIPEHVRGDESLGWVRKDYVLQANPEASP